MGKIVLITACGGKKEKGKRKAAELYKSARIRHLYRRSKELNLPFYILSAKYGLVFAEEEIEPYEAVMTEEKCKELLPNILEKLKDYEVVIYYRGGARKEYYDCIKEACETLGKKFVSFGYGNMGDIRKLDSILESLRK
jgi:hypothetical protein